MKWFCQYILLYFPGDSKTPFSWESTQCAFILFPWGYNVMTCSPWKISGHCKMPLCWWCHVNLWFSYMLDIGSCEPWNFSGVMMKTLKQRGIVCLFQWRPVSNNSLTSAIQEVMVPVKHKWRCKKWAPKRTILMNQVSTRKGAPHPPVLGWNCRPHGQWWQFNCPLILF